MTSPVLAAVRDDWGRAVAELRRRRRPIVIYQLLSSMLASLVVVPLATVTLRAVLQRGGRVAVNNYDLVGFFLSPGGLTYLLLAIATGLTLFFLLHAGLVLLTAQRVERRNPIGTLRRVVRKLPVLVPLGLRQLGGMLLALLPFLGLVAAVMLPLLSRHNINYYLHESPPEWRRALVVAGLAAVGFLALGSWLAARWSLAVPAVMLDGEGAGEAMRTSWAGTRGRAWRIVRVVGGWWLLLFALDLAGVAIVTGIARPLAAAAGAHTRLVFVLVMAVLSLVALIGFAWLLAGHAGHAALVNALYHATGGRERELHTDDDAPAVPLSPGVLALVTLGVFAVVSAIGKHRIDRLVFREDVQVTGHRGSGNAPENSLTAIRQAIDAHADWAEIDVQRTRDGAVIVLHDGDLMRLGGDPRKVGDLTLAEIQAVDIGTRKDPTFAGEHVPTLQQVLDAARGKLRVNIELKYNRPDSLLVPEVLRIVRDNGMTEQVSITSLDYAALEDVERRAPEFRTGMIVTKSVGLTSKLRVDFLSVNQAAASDKLLAQAGAQGKDVHVWTVNTRDDMMHMIELGVDNLITDFPGEAVAVRAERAAMSTSEKVALRLRRLLVR